MVKVEKEETTQTTRRTFPSKRPERVEKQTNQKAIKRKNWRLIARNLPFSCTEEDVRKAFQEYGQILELTLPKAKKDPKRGAGFAFVQFEEFPSAHKAFKKLNMTNILGRKIALDWAVPKDTYMTAVLEDKPSTSVTETASTSEPATAVSKKNENDEDESDDGDEDEESEDDSDEKPKQKWSADTPDPAVEEGRTVFVRNLSFDTDNDELNEKFSNYGSIKLALVCKYPGSVHSKGSGFVQFEKKESADKCINEGSEEFQPGIVLAGRRLIVCRAVDRQEAVKMEKANKEKQPKDNRNMPLLRVGLIRSGTTQANNMSDADGKKRTALELSNRSKIKNLHIFVSPTRLTIHNLPTSVDDKALRKLCMESVSDGKARITECRIWRDRARLNADGTGRSRGYGFVQFSEHKHALACVTSLNNNPDIFTDQKRPIVQFSLENKVALNKKQTRLEKSKANLHVKTETKSIDRKQGHASTAIKSHPTRQKDVEFTKIEMKKGGQKPLPSHLGPKIRHKPRTEEVKKKKKPSTKKSRTQIRAEKKDKILTTTGKRKSTDTKGAKNKKKRSHRITKFLTLS